jgi:hypothetical protein
MANFYMDKETGLKVKGKSSAWDATSYIAFALLM